jgi:hypothetical protein
LKSQDLILLPPNGTGHPPEIKGELSNLGRFGTGKLLIALACSIESAQIIGFQEIVQSFWTAVEIEDGLGARCKFCKTASFPD